MIVNIRGTSGSGKSTVVRDIMAMYKGNRLKFYQTGRKQPIGYVHHRPYGEPGRSLAVVGHYETPCGGCDTINSMDEIFALVRESHDLGHDVIFEGLLISAEVNRMAALHADGYPCHVIALDVPLDLCLERVNGRRQAKTPGKGPVNPKNTESKHKGTLMSARRLQEAGVSVCTADNPTAVAYIKSLLEI